MLNGNLLQAKKNIEEDDFQFLKNLVYQESGIVIGNHKKDMILRRISRRMRELNIKDVRKYCDILRANNTIEIKNFTNLITTNLTAFFREDYHFQFLKNEFSNNFIASGKERLRIWSSACSSGEEPYSIAMSLSESLGKYIEQIDAKILATDIDTQVIKVAKSGIYSKETIKALDLSARSRWFNSVDDLNYQIKDELKSLITFNCLNLLGRWPMSGKFDVIFCRNVLIYFDKHTQKTIIDRFYDYLEDGGLLFLGHSESVIKGSHSFTSLGKTIFQKEGK